MSRKRQGKDIPCEICGKVFYCTPTRLRKNNHHTCSRKCLGILSSKKYSQKVKVDCKNCGKEIKYKKSEYEKIKNHTCSIKCSSELKSIIYSGAGNPSAIKLSHLSGVERVMHERISTYKSRAFQKGWDFDLDYKYLTELYNKQKGKCYYTNLKMKYKKGPKTFDTMSLDRIDSSKGYTKDNVVLCLNCINMLKSDHNMKDFKKVFRGIAMSERFTISTRIKKLYEDSQLPSKGSEEDAGYDLYVHRIEDNGKFIKVYTGVAIEPDVGFYYMLAPRSSTHKKGLLMSNNLGIIDNNYRGEIIGIFDKTNRFEKIPEIGDRLMQLIPQQQIWVEFEEVDELSETDRGSGGFGSTNK